MIQLQFLNRVLDSGNKDLLLKNKIDEEFFSDYRAEYRFIRNHINDYGNVPDINTFVDKFNKFDVIKVNETDDYLVDALYDEKRRRDLAVLFNSIRQDVQNGATDDALTKYFGAYENLSRSKKIKYTSIIQDTKERYEKYVDKCANRYKYFIPTGLSELDEALGGFDKEEEYGVIVARTSVGKTWIMWLFATAAARAGYRVGVYEGEMSTNKSGYRFDTLAGHISNSALTKGYSSAEADYQKYLDRLRSDFKGDLFVMTASDNKGPAKVSDLENFMLDANLDILFIDQMSLLDSSLKGRVAQNEKAAEISKELKLLQTRMLKPVMLVSQQNREKIEDGKHMGTENVSLSDRISQDATTILGLERDKDGKLHIYPIKARDGCSVNSLTYDVDLDKGRFTYVPENLSEEEAQKMAESFLEHPDTPIGSNGTF